MHILIAFFTVLAWSGFVCLSVSLFAYYVTYAMATRQERIIMDILPFRPWVMPTFVLSIIFLVAKYFVA